MKREIWQCFCCGSNSAWCGHREPELVAWLVARGAKERDPELSTKIVTGQANVVEMKTTAAGGRRTG
jgi:hypothetical protein